MEGRRVRVTLTGYACRRDRDPSIPLHISHKNKHPRLEFDLRLHTSAYIAEYREIPGPRIPYCSVPYGSLGSGDHLHLLEW